MRHFTVLETARCPASGEITDKGDLNPRAVLAAQHHLLDALYDSEPLPA